MKINNLLFPIIPASILLFSFGLFSCNTKSKPKEEITEVSKPIAIDMTSVKHIDTPIKLSQIATNIEYIALAENPLINNITFSPILIIYNGL